MNRNEILAYILPTVRSSHSTIRYQYRLFPSTGLRTLRPMRKSASPLFSVESAAAPPEAPVPEREERIDRLSAGGISNFRAWTSWRR